MPPTQRGGLPNGDNKLLTFDDHGGEDTTDNNHHHYDNNNDDNDESISHLKETIQTLKLSLMSTTEANAAHLEQLSTIQLAHDKLYKEHVNLQEQMDDAVELLKYLKEEKVGNEEEIETLKCQLNELQEEREGDVVSMTIENLTKRNMELERLLGMEREKVKHIKTGGGGSSAGGGGGGGTTGVVVESLVGALEKEREELLEKVESLEKKGKEYEGQVRKHEEQWKEMEGKNRSLVETLSNEKKEMQSQLNELRGENVKLKSESDERRRLHEKALEELKSSIEKEKEDLQSRKMLEQKEQQQQLERQKGEIDSLKAELSTSVARIAALQRESKSNSSVQEKVDNLEKMNKKLINDKKEMQGLLDALEEGLRYYQEQEDPLTGKITKKGETSQQQASQSSTECDEQQKNGGFDPNREQQLTLEIENLNYQIQHLQLLLETQNNATSQKEEAHATLEKQFQSRLVKRLTTQMNQTNERFKIDLDAQLRKELGDEIRKEVEEEYEGKYHEFLEQQAGLAMGAEEQRKQTALPSKSHSFHHSVSSNAASSPMGVGGSVQQDLEQQLRQQLQQVKEEREKWQLEQEQFQQKVLLSQTQLEKLREGYHQKVEKERKRSNELELRNEELGKKVDLFKSELDELKEQHEIQSATRVLLDQQSEEKLKQQRNELEQMYSITLKTMEQLQSENQSNLDKIAEYELNLINVTAEREKLKEENQKYIDQLASLKNKKDEEMGEINVKFR